MATVGDSFQTIAVLDVTPERAPEVGQRALDWLVQLGIVVADASDSVLGDGSGHRPGPLASTAVEPGSEGLDLEVNGVAVVAERSVFDGIGPELRCPACGCDFAPGEDWFEAVGAWSEGEDDVAFACTDCGHEQRLADWEGPEPWAVANLGLRFWNWPPLSQPFVAQLAAVVGSRARLVRGKL
jgi:hypothetical protein